jgi:phage terminase large subunit-like protein
MLKLDEIKARAFASEFLNDPVDDSLTLFKTEWIDDHRITNAADLPQYDRVAVGIDPSISAGGDACGIIAAALGINTRGYVLEDATVQGSPATWARKALDLAARVGASVIVAEGNQGGEMVEQTLRSVLRPGERLPRVVIVHASRSKQARAEPIAALYERGEVSHVGTLMHLESELVTWVPGLPSPNRLDALVWTLTELMLKPKPTQQQTQSNAVFYSG